MAGKLIWALTASAAMSGLFFLAPLPAFGAPITYIYDQTSATVPGFTVTASITIDGGFGDLPTISNFPGPYSFGNLLAFNMSLDSRSISLGDFTPYVPTNPYFVWTISPSGLYFINSLGSSDFRILGFGGFSEVSFNTDGPSSFGCNRTGVCKAQGTWLSTVPEPITLSLFGVGIAGAFAMRRRKLSLSRKEEGRVET